MTSRGDDASSPGAPAPTAADTRSGGAQPWRSTASGSGGRGSSGRASARSASRTATSRSRAAGAGDDATDAAGAGTTARRTGWRRVVDYPRSHVTSFRRWLPSWRVVVGSILGCIALGAGVLVAAYATTTVPDAPATTQYQTTTVYYSDGKTVIGTLRDNDAQNRKLVELADLPDYVKNAVVASEDRTFYKNSGVDLKGIARAAWTNLRSGSRQGGSTITQQTAERYYTTGTTTSYTGKLKEAMLAIKMSQSQDKDVILQNYLNTIYWGRNADGIEAASEAYFGKSAAKISPSQAALLAGIIPAPSAWDPQVDPDQAEFRWKRCLDFMLADGYITQEQHDDAVAKGLPKTKKVTKSQQWAGQNGYILTMVQDELQDQAGMTEDEINQRGMNIVTTIDKSMEKKAVAAVEATPKSASKSMGTGLVTIDPTNGEIKAFYGGPDYLKQQRNNITQARAQGGSTFKAFALAADLEAGDSLDHIYDGSNDQYFASWGKNVTNFEGESASRVTLQDAFAESINTVFAHVNDQVTPKATEAMAKRLGLETSAGSNAANVLGTASVHPLELAGAYSTFANEGIKTTPHIIRTAKQLDGKLVYEGSTKGKRVIDAEIADGVTTAGQDVVKKGTATVVQGLGRPVAGKTGSTNDNKAAWFVGYTPQLVTAVGVWQSGKDGSEQSISPFGGWSSIGGGTWPATLWTNYMKTAMDGMDVVDFPEYQDTLSTWTPTPTATETATEAPTPTETEAPADETVAVPDVAGKEAVAARVALAKAGFRVVMTNQPSDDVAAGKVISTSPPAGSSALKGSTVVVYVSNGPAVVVEKPTQAPTREPGSTPTQTASGGDGSGDGSGSGSDDGSGSDSGSGSDDGSGSGSGGVGGLLGGSSDG